MEERYHYRYTELAIVRLYFVIWMIVLDPYQIWS